MTLPPRATNRSGLMPMVTVFVLALALAAWVGFGRVLFGWTGTIGMIMSLTVAPIGLVLQGTAGLAMRAAVRRGHSIRRAVVACVLAVGSGVLFGATVPEVTDAGVRSLMAPTGQTWAVEMTIALCNPLGIVYLATTIATVVFSRLAVRGPSVSAESSHESGVG